MVPCKPGMQYKAVKQNLPKKGIKLFKIFIEKNNDKDKKKVN